MTRSFVIMTDQLKIDPTARKKRTSLPAIVACSNAKSRPPAAINFGMSISASPELVITDSGESERSELRFRGLRSWAASALVRDFFGISRMPPGCGDKSRTDRDE